MKLQKWKKKDKLHRTKSTKTLISSSHSEVPANKPIIILKNGKEKAKIFMDIGAVSGIINFEFIKNLIF